MLKNDVSRKQTEFADAPDQVKANLRVFGRVLHDDRSDIMQQAANGHIPHHDFIVAQVPCHL
ncbi:hypothetical protein D3C75_1276330 [compost metagenome]